MSEKKLPEFLQKAINTHKIHVANLRSHDKWTITLTAKALGRSLGSVSEDIMIARWYRTHSNSLEKMKTAQECLEWIRAKEKEMESTDV